MLLLFGPLRGPRNANPMIRFLFGRPEPDPIIAALYGTIVAQARCPSFYHSYGVPDTVTGRFEMIVLHLVLLLRRLKSLPSSEQVLGQEVFNLFCRDMDDNFREMGVGDLAVPKQMRKVGETFYGRVKAYETALSAGIAATTEVLARIVFGSEPVGARGLAAYMLEAESALASQTGFPQGVLHFPDPQSLRLELPMRAVPHE